MLTKSGTERMQTAPAYSVPPVVRAIKVLRHIAAGRSVANHSKAAREIGINRTTLLRLLHTLQAEGLIEPAGSVGDYVLGTGMIELAAQKLDSIDVAQIASPILARLAATIGLSCHLGILDRREVLYVLRSTPNVHLVSNVRIGTRLPAHASSMGRALLAYMPREEVEELFRGVELKKVNERSPTTLDALRAILDEVREAGIVDGRSSFEAGIDAIAAPVIDHAGKVVAAINASGPSSAFETPLQRRTDIASAVREAATEISRQLGWVPTAGRVATGRTNAAQE